MKVIDALFSAGKDELISSPRSRPLSAGHTELVSVKDHENTVRVWLDSKNVTDDSFVAAAALIPTWSDAPSFLIW